MFHKLKKALRPREVTPEPTPRYVAILLEPEKLSRIIPYKPRLSFMLWYTAIYLVYNDPDIKPSELVREIGVTYTTAKKMIIKIIGVLA